MKKIVAIAMLLALAACAAPQQKCVTQADQACPQLGAE